MQKSAKKKNIQKHLERDMNRSGSEDNKKTGKWRHNIELNRRQL